MPDGPRVTVVIPTCNRAALLVEAIESVLQQSYRSLEVVVCDDGSSDDTAARVEAFGQPVRYLQLAHAGRPGSPRNRGIEVARGELVAFLDDDDLWEPDKLSRQVELLDRGGLDLVYSDRRFRFSDGSASGTIVTPAPVSPERLLDLVIEGNFPCVCTLLTKRAVLQRVGGFDETLVTGEDLDLWLRLGSVARAGKVPEPLVVIRRRPGSLSDRSGSPLAFRNAIRVLERSLATGGLDPRQRRLCRATLGRLEARLAATLTRRGDSAGARRAALRAVRRAPATHASWAALARTIVPKRATRPEPRPS